MKEFIGTFFTCIVVCGIGAFFFFNFILENTFVLIIFIAFLLAILMTILVNQDSKIEELEKKVERLLKDIG